MALATALALSGLKLLDVPYANQIVVVSLSVGLGALAVWGVVVLVRRRARLQAGGPGVPESALVRLTARSNTEKAVESAKSFNPFG